MIQMVLVTVLVSAETPGNEVQDSARAQISIRDMAARPSMLELGGVGGSSVT